MAEQRIERLKEALREEFYLDLDKYLVEEKPDLFTGGFVGLRLHTVFQPITDRLQNTCVGFEALLRSSLGGITPVPPLLAFHYAEERGDLVKFDRICRALHLLNSLQLPVQSELLFLNVHPGLLVSVNAHGRVFEQILHLYSVPTYRVVIEIRESAVDDDSRLRDAVASYRSRGYKIAIDQFGGRRSSLDRLWRLAPDFVKFDGSIIRDHSADWRLARLLPKLVELVHEVGAEAVIEGIETEEQLDRATASGARFLQGNFPGMPAPASKWRASSLRAAQNLSEDSLIRWRRTKDFPSGDAERLLFRHPNRTAGQSVERR